MSEQRTRGRSNAVRPGGPLEGSGGQQQQQQQQPQEGESEAPSGLGRLSRTPSLPAALSKALGRDQSPQQPKPPLAAGAGGTILPTVDDNSTGGDVPLIHDVYGSEATSQALLASASAARGAVQELSPSDNAFVKSLVKPGDSLKFFASVDIAMGKINANKNPKFERALFVVTRFRWFYAAVDMLKRQKVKKQAHIFQTHLIAPGDDNATDVKIVFDESPGVQAWLLVRGVMASEVASAVFSSWKRVSDHLVDVPDHEFQLTVTYPGIVDNTSVPKDFYKLYEAVCALHNLLPCDAFSRFYQQYANSGVLNLTLCPGFEPGSQSVRLDLPPLFIALGLNAQVHSIVCRNPLAPEGFALANVVRLCSRITKLVITEVEGTIDWLAVASALQANIHNRLHILDFSGNTLNEKASSVLCSAFQNLKHGLSVLRLSKCGLKTKQLVTLFDSFRGTPGMSTPLLELDLSHNEFKEEASRSMSRWLHSIGSNSQLRRLILHHSCVEVGQLVSAGLGLLPYLQRLDVSNNVLDDAGVQVLSVILERTLSITNLLVGDCAKMSHEGIHTLFTVMQRNSALNNSSISFCGTEPGVKITGIPLWELGNRQFSLVALDLSRCQLGATTTIKMLSVIEKACIGLADLAIGGNCDCRSDLPGTVEMIAALIDFVDNKTTLVSLSVRGTRNSRLGPSLYKLFQLFQTDTKVTKFDFSHNGCGDAAFLHFTEALHVNSTLREIGVDGNSISYNSFLSLSQSVDRNAMIHKLIDIPEQDVAAALASMPPHRHPKLHDTVRRIDLRLNFNDARHKLFATQKARNATEEFVPPSNAPRWWPHGADDDDVDPGLDCAPLFDPSRMMSAPSSTADYGTVIVNSVVPASGSNDLSLARSGEINIHELSFANEIGRGSFGIVFAGTWRGGKVAIKKLLLPAHQLVPSQIAKFQAEADTMQRLRPHVNVVQFLGFTLSPQLCIVTEYLPNRSLRERLDSGIRPHNLKALCCGISAGLLHLHAENIFHGDLATRNILVGDTDSTVKLADFGQAKQFVEDYAGSNTHEVEGPLKWMSPERISEGVSSRAGDVWSLGVTLYEIVSMKLPYEGLSPLQAALQVSSRKLNPIPPSDCYPILKTAIEQCCQFDPEDRPSTQQLFTLLEGAVDPSQWSLTTAQ